MYTRREFNKSEVALSNEIKSKLIEVEGLLDKLPNCREKSIALTHIEETLMWMNRRVEDRMSRPSRACELKYGRTCSDPACCYCSTVVK